MENKELDLAWEFVNYTQKSVFLTGKAGTGKTTFLHRLKNESVKSMAIVAPTGVAAINARGITMHSLFQLPFGPIPPDTVIKRDFKQKFSKKKIQLIKSLDLLIIDEISMVRADLLDAIDRTLRRYKNKQKVFGGTQVLMIGDLQQLAPVVKPQDWELLKKYYETPYFFSSRAYQEVKPVNIELKKIYRQNDEIFINVLNEVRENRLSKRTTSLLNKRYIPGFSPPDNEDYITLTTHNYKAEKINRQKLSDLQGKTFYFHALIEGHFPENAYPNDLKLALKKDAQVMFIKNDSSPDKRYYNGKIGRITFIDDKSIFVKCPGDEEEIEVNREKWENITYEVEAESGRITEKVQGSFAQIPLRLAWAITIHKSQGLTFDKAIIDAELSFAHGQTYVALSRCKTLDGLVLQSPLKSQSIINDQRINNFNEYLTQTAPGQTELSLAKKQFFIETLAELFDYTPLQYRTNRLLHLYKTQTSSIQGNVKVELDQFKQLLDELSQVSHKFIRQMQQMAARTKHPEQEDEIQKRLEKALSYYRTFTHEQLQPAFEKITFDIEQKQLKKDFEKHYLELTELLAQKISLFQHLKIPYTVFTYLNSRREAILKSQMIKKEKSIKKLPEIVHDDLFDALKTLRSHLALKEDIPNYQVFTQESLYQLCEKLPVTERQLKKIKGIGKNRIKKYGEPIISLIKDYCIVNNIMLKEDEPLVKETKKNTKEISLDMFKAGKNVEEIANERHLTTGTIWNHLAYFVPTGEIKMADLIPKEKIKAIQQIMTTNKFENLTELKQIAGDNYSWNELRLIMKQVENKI